MCSSSAFVIVANWRGLKKLWPACLLIALFLLLAAFYNPGPSWNSDVLWLSLRPPASSSSLISPEFSVSPKPNFRPDFIQQVNSVEHVKDPLSPISSQDGDTQQDFANPERGVKEADEPSISSLGSSAAIEASKDSGNEDKAESSSRSQNFSTTSTGQHEELHKEHESSEARTLEQSLLAAKRAISTAKPKGNANLHAPIYRNLTMFTKSYELMEQMLKIYIYKEGAPPLVHGGPTVGIYASEGRFIHQLQSSKQFVTRDHSKAHLFFMPYSVTNAVRGLYVPDSHDMHPIISFVTGYVTTVSSKFRFWNLSHGADHFFVSCHDWGPATAREHEELRRNAIKVVCNADVNEEFVVGKDVSLPETSLRAAKPPIRLGGPPVKKRLYLAFFAGQMHGRVRPLLLQHWQDKDPNMKIYERIPSAIAKKTSYTRHMRMSKFCICPMGYEVNSPRIVEAIYYDCVPVIIADGFILPFSDVLDWQAFSVSVKEKDIPLLRDILLSIPEPKYNAMQASLKHVRKHFLWHYKTPVKYDIFHMTLHSIWLRRLAAIPVSLL